MHYEKIAPIMGLLWSPIAAITTSWQGKDNAQIAVSIAGASIVPDRPRVVVQLYKTNFSHNQALRSLAFAICFLRQDQIQLACRLGIESGRDREKLEGVPYRLGVTGSPILLDALGYMDCTVVHAMDGGDMTVFLADVVDGDMLAEGDALSWRHMRSVAPREWMERWDRKITGNIEVSRRSMDQIAKG